MQKLNIAVNLPFPSDVVCGTVLRKEISWISIVREVELSPPM